MVGFEKFFGNVGQEGERIWIKRASERTIGGGGGRHSWESELVKTTAVLVGRTTFTTSQKLVKQHYASTLPDVCLLKSGRFGSRLARRKHAVRVLRLKEA